MSGVLHCALRRNRVATVHIVIMGCGRVGSTLTRSLPAGSEPTWRDASGEVRLDQLYAPFGWIGHEIATLERQASARIAFITRLGSGMIPTDDTVIQEGDYLSVFLREDNADETHA